MLPSCQAYTRLPRWVSFTANTRRNVTTRSRLNYTDITAVPTWGNLQRTTWTGWLSYTVGGADDQPALSSAPPTFGVETLNFERFLCVFTPEWLYPVISLNMRRLPGLKMSNKYYVMKDKSATMAICPTWPHQLSLKKPPSMTTRGHQFWDTL